MTRRTIVLALAAVLCSAWAVSANDVAEDLKQEVETLRARLKDLEAANAMKDNSAFSFKTAGFLTAASSSYAGDYLSAADVAAAKALINACSSDVATLCKDAVQPQQGAPGSAWFPYYASVLQCLQQGVSSISDSCTAAGREAVAYMRDNRETLRLAVRKVSIKDAFEVFKASCAAEITDKCNADVLNVDVAAGVVATPWTDAFMRPRPQDGGHRRLRHHAMRALHGSGDELLGRDGRGRQWGHFISDLNAELGTCVAAVAPVASTTCDDSIKILGHVAMFAARGPPGFGGAGPFMGRDHHRALAGDWAEPDAPQEFPGTEKTLSPDADEEGLVGAPAAVETSSANESSSDEWSSSGESSSSEDSDFEDGGRNFGRHDVKGSRHDDKHSRRWRHREDAGGVIGFALIVAVVVMSVALCRRRRVIRELRSRLQQLEAATGGRPVPPAAPMHPGYPGVTPMHYPVGIPMPPMVAPAPSAPAVVARTPSDAEEEHAGLLRRSQAPQVVQPMVYPGHVYHPTGAGGYPNINPF